MNRELGIKNVPCCCAFQGKMNMAFKVKFVDFLARCISRVYKEQGLRDFKIPG